MFTRFRIHLSTTRELHKLASVRPALAAFVITLIVGLSCGMFLSNRSRAAQSEGALITGIVQDDKGVPIVDAKVSISSQDYSASVRTQADGKYEFTRLKPAQYRITADATSFRKQSITVTISRFDEIAVAPVIKLSASSLHVAVLDANNQGLRGVTVSLSQDDRGPGVVSRASTDEGGDVYFGRLAPGSYQLTAMLRGYDEYRYEVFISPGIMTELAVQLSVAPVIPVNEKAVVRYGIPNLPSKNVHCIFQDSEGWIWFGTDRGIARFNGTDFESSSGGSAYEHLAGEEVRSITEDSSGAMWLATPAGVRRIDKQGTPLESVITRQDVRHVLAGSDGTIWISTAEGLSRFDGRQATQLDRASGLPSNDVRATAADKSGKIWVATAAGLALVEGERVAPFEPKPSDAEGGSPAASATRATRRSGTPQRGANPETAVVARPGENEIRSIFVDEMGAVWFAGSRGVFVYDGKVSRRVTSEALASAGENQVKAVGQDRRGRISFALAGGGVLLHDVGRRQWQRVASLERSKVAATFTDVEGITWFATDNGVVRADLYSFVSFNASRGLPDNDVRAVAEIPPTGTEQDRGKLWFITGSGVSRIEDERFVAVDRLRANTGIRAMAVDGEGSYWFATEQGALRFSGQTVTQFGESNGLAANNVHYLTVLSDKSTIAFATSKGASIFKQGQIRSLELMSGYDVRHLFEDSDGRLWFATARGVVKVDPESNSSELIDSDRGLADNDTRAIIRFRDQLLIATRGGVQVFRGDRRGGAGFATFDGEPASTLFVDRDGYLWVGTDDGQVKKFANVGGYTIPAVYSGEAFALTATRINSISEDSSGQIWIATDKGAVRHLPIRRAPSTQISLRTDNAVESSTESGSVTLPYGRQRMTFSFTAASMTGQVRYLYRINPESANEAWSLLPVQPGARREVSLFGIDAGVHAFEVIALNRDLYGAGGDTPEALRGSAAALVVRVSPPFWTRWWFYVIGLALAAMAVAFIITTRRLKDRDYVLPRELRSYVPVEPNPYIVGNPIRTESMFFGREDDFRYVRTKLEGVSQGVVIVFCGERRVGKSSILYQVLNGRLGPRFVPVFVDMQEMVISSDSEFFARVSRLISEAVTCALAPAESTAAAEAPAQAANAALAGAAAVRGARGSHVVQVPVFDGRNPYPVFLDFLDEVLQRLSDRTLLILIDEYELMEAKVDEGKLSADLFTFLAGLMDNKERLALMFTGSRRLEERDKKYWRELLRRSLFRKVGFLSENDAVRLIAEPVANRLVYGRGVIEMVYRLTAGQPFYIQVMCQNIVDYINQNRQNWVTVADINQVIADIVDNPLPQMIYTWDGLSDDEKLVLSLLGEQLPEGNVFATARDLRSAVRSNDYPVNLSENTIRLTLEEMFRREMLEKDAADGFRFKIDLLRLWIRRSHSIWQVVKEVRTL